MSRRNLLVGSGGLQYTGILDTVGVFPLVSYSVRRLARSYTGPLVTLRRASDNAEQSFYPLSTGWLDDTDIAAWAGGSCYVAQWFDQSAGAKHFIQSTAAAQPLYSVGVTPATRSTLTFDGADDFVQVAFTNNQPQHIFSVFNRVSWTTADFIWVGLSISSMRLYQGTSSSNLYMFTGALGDPITYGVDVYRVATAYYNSADTSYFRVNGAQTNNGSAIGNNATGLTIGSDHVGTNNSHMSMSEFMLFPTKQSTVIQSSIESDQSTQYL